MEACHLQVQVAWVEVCPVVCQAASNIQADQQRTSFQRCVIHSCIHFTSVESHHPMMSMATNFTGTCTMLW